MAAMVRIVLGALLACLVAGLVRELAVARGLGQPLSLQNIVDTAVNSAMWAAPFGIAAVALTEWLRLRSALVYLLGGAAVALAAGLYSFDFEAPHIGQLFKLPGLSMVLSMGVAAGLTYWMARGYRAGWRGDAAEAQVAAGRQGLLDQWRTTARPKCWPCVVTGMLLAGLPLIGLGYLMIERPQLAEAVTNSTEVQAKTAFIEAGHPWASLQIDGHRGHVVGQAPTEAARTAAFDVAQKALAPAVGLPGVVAYLQNDITVPAVAAVAAATTTVPTVPAVTAMPAPKDDTAQRLADEERRRSIAAAEAKRKADEEQARSAAEAKRRAEDDLARVAAEAKRKADEDQVRIAAEAKRKADEDQARVAAEAKRKADEDQVRIAAEAKRKADEELARIAAEAKQKADEERARQLAEAKRKTDEDEAIRIAEAKRKADTDKQTTVIVRTPAPAAPAVVAAPAAPAVPAAPVAQAVAGGCDTDTIALLETTRVTFDTASTNLGAPDEAALERVAAAAKLCTAFKIRVAGHTDNVGAAGYNAGLAAERAAMVKGLLLSRGIPAERLEVSSLGGTRPMASNDTEAGRAQNRRVEFIVLGSADPALPANAARVAACKTDFGKLLSDGGLVFNPSSAVVAQSSLERLNAIAAAAKACTAFGLLVEGHADKTGNPVWNLQLSDLRAKAIREALIARGVPAARIDAKGFGSSRPIDSADTKEAHARNRRIEISLGAPARAAN